MGVLDGFWMVGPNVRYSQCAWSNHRLQLKIYLHFFFCRGNFAI